MSINFGESRSTGINQCFQKIPLLKYMTLLQREREGNMPRVENRKLEWFIKQADEDEDLNFFR
jgi:hypothetical protein